MTNKIRSWSGVKLNTVFEEDDIKNQTASSKRHKKPNCKTTSHPKDIKNQTQNDIKTSFEGRRRESGKIFSPVAKTRAKKKASSLRSQSDRERERCMEWFDSLIHSFFTGQERMTVTLQPMQTFIQSVIVAL